MKLFLKNALFTVVMPGTFAGLVPPWLAADSTEPMGLPGPLAFCLLALGSFVYLRCVWDFAVFGKGTPAPIDAPKRLVIRGFYRYTRNPMYVAILTVVGGWAIFLSAVILVVYAVALFVFFSLFVRLYEEPHLSKEFGDEYKAYLEQVGRWLPRRPGRKGARADE